MFGNSLVSKDNASRPPKPPPRRTGGWAEESSKMSKLEKQLSSFRLQRQESDKDVDNIPDLGARDDEDLDDGPNKTETMSKVATYKELDDDMSSSGNFAFLHDIDLRPLTRHLLPGSQIKDPDVVWDWEVLFAELSPELELKKPV